MKLLKFLLMWAGSSWFGLLHEYKYCPVWDEVLGRLLDKHSAEAKVGRHTTTLGGVEVWTSNAFYAYGYLWEGLKDSNRRRPSLFNMYRLWLIQDADRVNEACKAKEEYARRMREVANG